MKKQSKPFSVFFAYLTCLVLLAGMFPHTALADSYTSSAMRLLHYEGTVEIEDASGNPRAVMENARLNSGESMKTAAASSASVGLDDGRIVTMDEKSRVEFEKQDGAVSMNLTEGRIFLDVSEKLGAEETMDIKTSTMVVGIRGTIVYISSEPVTDEKSVNMESVDLKGLSPEKGSIVSISQIGVLEGTAEITYLDNSKQQQSVSVDAGQKATVPEYSEDAEGISEPAVSDITKEDIEGFVLNQVISDASVTDRVKEACDVVDDIEPADFSGDYPANGDWTWNSTVTLVAQSASKYYDGQPLTRTSDILVNNLPSAFSVKASAGGSRTDAGESDNPVSNYAIYNKAGEDVTSHFTNIETVSGTLLVVPAPLTIHTGTAEKVYDGTPLTDPDAYVTFYKGSGNREVPWRNTSYVVTESAGNASYDSQTLYGICGVIWVNAANPLTGERREIQLKAGQKLTVFLSDLEGKQSIELKIENLTENDLPEELLRLYGDNPALLAQACKDTGWNIELIRERIDVLPKTPSGTATIEQGGLVIRESESDRLMQDLTNVRITIDTEITDYNNRALGSEEAHYSGLSVDESIKVTATGSQTDVGTSVNTYTIDWGTANLSNYEVGEDLGTLTVIPASATVTTGSAEKVYDGETLFYDSYELSPSDPWVNGQAPKITVTGSITNAGSSPNTCMVEWKGVNPNNYSVTQEYGTLTVRPVEIVLISDCAYEVAGDIIIDSYGLKVQVNNVDSSNYYVNQTDENEWRISFSWGDIIDASTFLIKDETSFAITPIHDLVSGNPDNYDYSTVDQEGMFDKAPVHSDDEDGKGSFSTYSGAGGRSLSGSSEMTDTSEDEEADQDALSDISEDENKDENEDENENGNEDEKGNEDGSEDAIAEPASTELIEEEQEETGDGSLSPQEQI